MVDKMKEFIKEWYVWGCKIKIYYMLCELSNVIVEIWVICSLGNEILRGGNGGGFLWCCEYFVMNYIL